MAEKIKSKFACEICKAAYKSKKEAEECCKKSKACK